MASYAEAWLCSPRREHFPDCRCDSLGTRLKIGGMDAIHVPPATGADPRAPVVIYCHGNRRNICSCAHMVKVFDHCHLVLFDYRGFGRSDDGPEALMAWGLACDVVAVISECLVSFPDRAIFVYGHSLGAAIALNALSGSAILDRVSGLILEGAFHTPSAVAPYWPIGGWLAWALGLDAKYPAGDRLAHIGSRRVMLIHSVDDAIVPYAEGEKLAREIRAPIHRLAGPHNKPCYNESYRAAIQAFIERRRNSIEKAGL